MTVVGQCSTQTDTNTNDKLASCGTPSLTEGDIMHDQNILNRLQAIDVTEAGIGSFTSGASSQAGNARLYSAHSNARLYSAHSSTTAQHGVK